MVSNFELLSKAYRSLSSFLWTSTVGWNHVSNPSSITFSRIHQTTSSVVVTPGVITFVEKASLIIALLISTNCE